MEKIQEQYSIDLIKKVFIHELGHFLANLINYKHSQLSKPETIHFYPCEEDETDLCGHLVVEKPEGYKDEIAPKERLAEYIGKTVMGCVFQSYFHNVNLEKCLYTNGSMDSNGILTAKNKHAMSVQQMQRLSKLEDTFVIILKNAKALEFVYDLDPLQFIQEPKNNEQWDVNMNKLSDFIAGINLEPFEKLYLTFLENLRIVIHEKL